MEQEVFTDIVKGEKRRIDIMAEVKIKDQDELVLVHIEPQSYYQKEFHERMFVYCSRLYEKYRKPILPIAVFSYNDLKEVPTQFRIHFPSLSVLQFNYLQLHLTKLNWRAFIQSNNPAAAALLSKMGYTDEERVPVKLEFLRMLSLMELDPAQTELIYGFFETYLMLNKEEEKQMRKEIDKLPEEEADRILELPNSYKEEGRREGREEGMEEGKKWMVQSMLEKGLSNELIADIAGLGVMEVKEMRKHS